MQSLEARDSKNLKDPKLLIGRASTEGKLMLLTYFFLSRIHATLDLITQRLQIQSHVEVITIIFYYHCAHEVDSGELYRSCECKASAEIIPVRTPKAKKV